MKTIIVLLILLFPFTANAKRLHKESVYQQFFCDQLNGVTEQVLPNKKRVDCVATIDGLEYAIEADFADKWAESVGQSLHYGYQMKRWPGILLIVEDEEKDAKNVGILQELARKLRIRVWVVTPNDMPVN